MKTLKELHKKVSVLLKDLQIEKYIELTQRFRNDKTYFSITLSDNKSAIESYLFVTESTLERAYLRLEFELKMKLLK